MAAVSRLTRKLSEERASSLAGEALELAKSGSLQVNFCPHEHINAPR